MGDGSTDGTIEELGDGLRLRHARPTDAEALAEFNARIHGDPIKQTPDEGIAIWTRDLLARPHPTFRAADFMLVEEVATGQIVSSLNLISQTWSYEGIPFSVGRPELVGSDLAYRRRGLVRLQMEHAHRWSAERGEMVQAITGIAYYYRQFGYEMTLELGGARLGYSLHVPGASDGATGQYTVRAATEADLRLIAALYERAMNRYAIACLRDEAMWRYELMERSERGITNRVLCIIEREGEPVGYLAHPDGLWGSALVALQYELLPGISWLAATPSVIRYLWSAGERIAARDEAEGFGSFGFAMGTTHPVYEVADELLPRAWNVYAWYLRVPDVPGFVRHIAPALEERLARSLAVGHSGELKLSFFRSGLRLRLEGGSLREVEAWRPDPTDPQHACFPGLTFLQLLFGFRSLAELEAAFPDCISEGDEARVLLNALFPKRPSAVWPIS